MDDRHNGQLQVNLTQGAFQQLTSMEERYLAAAKSVLFLVAYHLLQLGYFLGLAKSILKLDKNLCEEITQWLFLESWDDPLPWRRMSRTHSLIV